MALDGLYIIFANPLWWLLQLLLVAGGTKLLQFKCGEAVSRFGLGRIARGYACALIGIHGLSFAEASQIFYERIEKFSEASDLVYWSTVPGWSLFHFGINGFCALAALACVCVPLLLHLYRRGVASIANFSGLIFLYCLLVVSLWFHFGEPDRNTWQYFNPVEHYFSTLGSVVTVSLVAALSFSIGARIPLIRPLNYT